MTARVSERPIPRLALRPREAADSLGVSLGQFLAWVKDGKMPKPVKCGRNLVLYDADELRHAWGDLRDSLANGHADTWG